MNLIHYHLNYYEINRFLLIFDFDLMYLLYKTLLLKKLSFYLKEFISKKQREIKQLKDDLRIVYLQEKGEDYL